MIKVDNICVSGFGAAIRGMRNPMNSWHRSDSFVCDHKDCDTCMVEGYDCALEKFTCVGRELIVIGKNDLSLMKMLYKAGPEHAKYLRMIHVSMDVLAPLYWWKEADQYRISSTTNSCSTMHKVHAKDFVLEDFSYDQLMNQNDINSIDLLLGTISNLNIARENYLATKDKKWWWQMIQLLPSSYNQLRTWDFDYQTAISIIKQRTGHKLDEWGHFIDTLMRLPYIEKIIGD